jgi:hypothetical protein
MKSLREEAPYLNTKYRISLDIIRVGRIEPLKKIKEPCMYVRSGSEFIRLSHCDM